MESRQNRREFCKQTLLAPVGLSLAGLFQSCAEKRQKRPNIIFILADDLGYGDLGCYGQKDIQTPNIDKLAAEGMRFMRHYSGSTVCAPSRHSLMTGRHTGHSYLRGNSHSLATRRDPDDMTVATFLKQAGYHTALIGKSPMACWTTDAQLPNDKGFDYAFGYLDHGKAHHYFPKTLYRNGEKINYPDNNLHTGTVYSDDLILEESLKYIEERAKADQPFFIHLALQIPHASLVAEEKWKAKYRNKFDEQPVTDQNHYTNQPEPKTTYAAMVSRMDWDVGQVLNKLQELGLDENTIVLFSSDNGSMNEGGYQRTWFKSSGELRGGKRDLYEGGVRVPLIVRWPGKIEAGSKSQHISAFWDFLPTALEIAGAKIPNDIDGISFLPTLLGKENQKEHDHLYWEFHEQNGKRAVLAGDWKAVQLNMHSNPGKIELYNLADDPSETNDIADSHPDKVNELAELMEKAHSPHPVYYWGNPDLVRK